LEDIILHDLGQGSEYKIHWHRSWEFVAVAGEPFRQNFDTVVCIDVRIHAYGVDGEEFSALWKAVGEGGMEIPNEAVGVLDVGRQQVADNLFEPVIDVLGENLRYAIHRAYNWSRLEVFFMDLKNAIYLWHAGVAQMFRRRGSLEVGSFSFRVEEMAESLVDGKKVVSLCLQLFFSCFYR
jgi:hypothetical protein